jgi:hypothetical protein
MQWLLTSHVRRYHKHYGSSGHVWQGRFKSFAVQRDEHLITTLRYVLQNPVRAGLSETVHEWPWSSARRRQLVDRSPVDEEIRWSEQLESRLDELQVATIRECLNRQRPFGQSEWQTEMAVTFGLGSTLRPGGRPRSEKKVACPPFNPHVIMDTSVSSFASLDATQRSKPSMVIASGAAIVCHGSSFEADRHRMLRMVAFGCRHMANKKAKRVVSGEQLAKATAQKVFAWENVRRHASACPGYFFSLLLSAGAISASIFTAATPSLVIPSSLAARFERSISRPLT